MTRTFKYIIYRDDQFYVSQCLNVELSSFGDTPKEAINNLNEALTLYFEDKETIHTIMNVAEIQVGETRVNI